LGTRTNQPGQVDTLSEENNLDQYTNMEGAAALWKIVLLFVALTNSLKTKQQKHKINKVGVIPLKKKIFS